MIVNPEALWSSDEQPVQDANSSRSKSTSPSTKKVDTGAYSYGRSMNPAQELLNAFTMVPPPFYCLYFLLSGNWISSEDLAYAREDKIESNDWDDVCIQSSLFPSLHFMPPLPIIALFIGTTLHGPCSFLYHWNCAMSLPAGPARIEHWSRRMDQAGIHMCSVFWSYATSGSWAYVAVNALFNMDCMRKQFEEQIVPRRNQVRIFLAMLAYTAPLLWRDGGVEPFCRVWAIFIVGIWLFVAYPIGGWSHGAFHVVIWFVLPILFQSACDLPASRDFIDMAGRCAVLREE
mmetsp:Transcript_28678/g.42478  ORF Transcript_28678/g.42478 Transcript_28678/m.42478 type:complete len:289 (-) Transcript_28678:75-941(-)